jgi:hypothetical protein
MITTPCVICRRPSAQGYACAACEQRMADQLTDVLEFYALAAGELLPGSSTGARGTERSIGVRLAALDFRAGHDAVAILASWESEWREHYGLSVEPMLARPAPALSRSVAFLRGWLHRACEDHPAVDEFARELRDCWSEGQAAARVTPAASVTSIGCPADDERHDDGICGKRIGIDAGERQVQCPRCKTVWDVPHLVLVALSTPGSQMWADPEAAARYFRVQPADLRRIAKAADVATSHGRYDLRGLHAAMQAEGYARLRRAVVGS